MTDEIPEGGEPRTLGEDPPWGRLVLGYLSEGRDRRLRIFARADATFIPVEEVYGAYVCWWEDGEDDADWVEASEVAAVRQAHGGDDVKVLPGEWRTAWAPGAFSCLAFAEEDAREACPWITGLAPAHPC